MFICSVRAGTIRFFCVVGAALLVLTALVVLVPSSEAVATGGTAEEHISFEGVDSNEARIAFLRAFGWEVEQTPRESTTVAIPEKFDKVFAAYNELQRKQGLDLAGYSGKTVERHTYAVTNYTGHEGTVLVNLLIYRGRVIGGDVCSAEAGGFVHGLSRP